LLEDTRDRKRISTNPNLISNPNPKEQYECDIIFCFRELKTILKKKLTF